MTDLHPAFRPALQHLEATLRGMRAGRASAALVEGITVDAYGSALRLKEVGNISTPDPRTIQIEPWDRSLITAVEKAIATSPLGVNPVSAGGVVRVPLPALTAERRQELAKLVRQAVEDAKISIRNAREKRLKELKGQKEQSAISEDAFERGRTSLQNEVDAAVGQADALGKAKEEETLKG